jgi:hypothetical protein
MDEDMTRNALRPLITPPENPVEAGAGRVWPEIKPGLPFPANHEEFDYYVKVQGLSYRVSGQPCVEVVRSALKQKPEATLAEYTAALKYCAVHDTVMGMGMGI